MKSVKAKKNKICFSTGNFYISGKKKDLNKDILKCSKLDIEGVEIIFGTLPEVNTFKPKKQTLKFLKTLNYNTIHAPFHFNNDSERIYYKNSSRYKKLLEKLHKFYDKINAYNINFHTNLIKNYKLLKPGDYQYSIENSMGTTYTISNYRKILANNPHLKLVIDTTHSLEHSKTELKELIKNFKKKIIYVHLSGFENEKGHIPLHMLKSKNSLKLIYPIRKLNVPMIIETWIDKPTIIKIFKKEISFVKKWLNQN